MTLCMECAYVENLLVRQMNNEDPKLRNLMANNALKNVGAGDAMVRKKLKVPHVKNIVLYWLWQARSSLLHKDNSVTFSSSVRS